LECLSRASTLVSSTTANATSRYSSGDFFCLFVIFIRVYVSLICVIPLLKSSQLYQSCPRMFVSHCIALSEFSPLLIRLHFALLPSDQRKRARRGRVHHPAHLPPRERQPHAALAPHFRVPPGFRRARHCRRSLLRVSIREKNKKDRKSKHLHRYFPQHTLRLTVCVCRLQRIVFLAPILSVGACFISFLRERACVVVVVLLPLFVYLFIYLFICLFVYLFVYLFVCLFVCLFSFFLQLRATRPQGPRSCADLRC